MTLAEWLEMMIKERKVSKTDLQHACAARHWSTVQAWFLGAQPSAENLQGIEQALRLTPTERLYLHDLAAQAPGAPKKKRRPKGEAIAVVKKQTPVAEEPGKVPPAVAARYAPKPAKGKVAGERK